MRNKIKILELPNKYYYLSMEKKISHNKYSLVCESKLKKHPIQKASFKNFFICGNQDCDEIIEENIVVKFIENNPSLEREIGNLLELSSEPHIIHILKFDNKYLYGKNYFATIKCKGGDLFEYINGLSRYPTEKEVIIIMKQLIMAIRECHRHKIVHGDIKLENIGLVNPNDISEIRLLDFGGSIKIDDSDNLCDPGNINIQASPHYIPPEMITHSLVPIKYVRYIDFWELGIVMYALLTCSFPYDKFDDITKNKLIWPRKVNISPKMKSIVETLLKKNPLERCDIDVIDVF